MVVCEKLAPVAGSQSWTDQAGQIGECGKDGDWTGRQDRDSLSDLERARLAGARENRTK